MDEETITITLAEYKQLVHDGQVLDALYASGVDNWEWYGEAIDSVYCD